MGFQEYIAFTILVPCILSMWLSQLSLCAHMKFGRCFWVSHYVMDIPDVRYQRVKIILPSVPRSSKCPIVYKHPTKTLYIVLLLPLYNKCSIHLILLDLIMPFCSV
jgi:hypothetical protein